MKKIKRIKELKQEKQRLSRRESELKELIQSNWAEVKEAARPVNLLRSYFSLDGGRKYREKRPWVETLSYGAGLGVGILAHILTQRAEHRIEAKVAQKIEWALNKLFRRRK